MGQVFTVNELANTLLTNVSVQNGYFDNDFWRGQSSAAITEAREWMKKHKFSTKHGGEDLGPSRAEDENEDEDELEENVPDIAEEDVPDFISTPRGMEAASYDDGEGGYSHDMSDYGYTDGDWDENGDDWEDIIENNRRRVQNARRRIKNRRAGWKKYAK